MAARLLSAAASLVVCQAVLLGATTNTSEKDCCFCSNRHGYYGRRGGHTRLGIPTDKCQHEEISWDYPFHSYKCIQILDPDEPGTDACGMDLFEDLLVHFMLPSTKTLTDATKETYPLIEKLKSGRADAYADVYEDVYKDSYKKCRKDKDAAGGNGLVGALTLPNIEKTLGNVPKNIQRLFVGKGQDCNKKLKDFQEELLSGALKGMCMQEMVYQQGKRQGVSISLGQAQWLLSSMEGCADETKPISYRGLCEAAVSETAFNKFTAGEAAVSETAFNKFTAGGCTLANSEKGWPEFLEM